MTQTGGDKELVIGNKQLISLFFVVVALCGVFFAMGYMIGRNSTKTTLGSDAASAVPPDQRQQPEPPREAAPAPQEQPKSDPAPIDTRDAKATQEPTPPPAPEPKKDFVKTEEPKPAPPSSGARISTPEPGASYLQVTAMARPDVDGVVKTLKDQDFPTILAPSSKEGLYRVLVGPYPPGSKLADAKGRLKALGFGGAIVFKQQ
jgi:cell division septation protein DedD